MPVTFSNHDIGGSGFGSNGNRMKLSANSSTPRKHKKKPVLIPPESSLAIPPPRKITPNTNTPIAMGHSCFVGRGACGSASGVAGGGGAWKFGSWGALISLISYERVYGTRLIRPLIRPRVNQGFKIGTSKPWSKSCRG